MPAAIFRIENGVLALAPVGASDPPEWQAPGGASVDTVTLAAYEATGMNLSCQVTSGALNASPNTTDQTTPATFCDPEVTTTSVGVTSYTLDVTGLQDPQVPDGVTAWLFEHDAEEAYFYLGLNGDATPPAAIGRVRVVAGAFGGDARTDLTFTLSAPVQRKPDLWVGTLAANRVILGSGTTPTPVIPATGATEVVGVAGSWTPSGSTPPSNVADLIAGTPNAVTASPTTAWTTGSFMQTVEAGTSGQAHWNGTAWVAGVAP